MALSAGIDHAAGARDAGMSMPPPAMVLIYGKPKGGTPIMLATPLTALDVLLRALVREQESEGVVIAIGPSRPCCDGPVC